MTEYGDRLRRVRTQHNLSMGQLAERAGVDRSTISRIESGITPSPGMETLRLLAQAMNELPDSLTGRRTTPPTAQVYPGIVAVPIAEYVRVSAGEGSWIETGETTGVEIDKAKGRKLAAARVTGDCMEPDAYSGEVAVFDLWRKEPQDGEMVVCRTDDGDLLVKWFYREPDGSVVLESNDGQVIRPNGLVVEGVVVQINHQPRRKPRRGTGVRTQ